MKTKTSKLQERIRKRKEKLRRRYKEIRGKQVDWIHHFWTPPASSSVVKIRYEQQGQ